MKTWQQNNSCRNIVLSTAYFPPISYCKAIFKGENIQIEQYENYIKQSYRNRCKIYGANGVQSLTIPIEEATIKKISIKEVKIDYKTPWQKQHFKSIESAYRTSPFYEYLIDDFMVYFTKKFTYLFDFNSEILHTILDILEIKKEISRTDSYSKVFTDKADLRNKIHPKEKFNDVHQSKIYPQVFDHKYGFQSDLSIIDLIFNLGPEAYSFIIGKY